MTVIGNWNGPKSIYIYVDKVATAYFFNEHRTKRTPCWKICKEYSHTQGGSEKRWNDICATNIPKFLISINYSMRLCPGNILIHSDDVNHNKVLTLVLQTDCVLNNYIHAISNIARSITRLFQSKGFAIITLVMSEYTAYMRLIQWNLSITTT